MPNKLDQYIASESQRQFSDSKRQIIESVRLGENHMSPAVEALYREGLKKVRSVFDCEYCHNPYLESNSKRELHLCPKCEPGRGTISHFLTSNKKAHLSPEDTQKIFESKTVRRGPFTYAKQK